MVHRCGASCYMEAYDCIPTKTSVRTVEVMLVQSKWPHGQHEVHCSQLEVEVHDKCNCGCKLKKENCNKYQYYHESSCRWVNKVILTHHHQEFTNCLCSDVFATIQKLDLLALLPIKFGIQIPANVIAQRIPFKVAQQVSCTNWINIRLGSFEMWSYFIHQMNNNSQNAFFRLHVWFCWLMFLRALSLSRRSFSWPGRPYCWNCHTSVPNSYYHYSFVSFGIIPKGESIHYILFQSHHASTENWPLQEIIKFKYKFKKEHKWEFNKNSVNEPRVKEWIWKG